MTSGSEGTGAPALLRRLTGMSLANGFFLVCQFGILIALARWTSIETVGRYGVVAAVVQAYSAFFQFGLRTSLASGDGEKHRYSTYLSAALIGVSLLIVSTVATIAVFRETDLLLGLALVILKSTELVSWLSYGAMQREGQIRTVALSMLFRGCLGLVFFVGVLALGGSLELAVLGQFSGWLAVLILHDFRKLAARGYHFAVDTIVGRVTGLIRHTLPLGTGQTLAALQFAAPRFVVDAILGIQAAALYTIASYFLRAGQSLAASIEQAFLGQLGRLSTAPTSEGFVALSRRLLVLAAAAGIATIAAIYLLGGTVLELFLGSEYLGALAVLGWVSIAIALRLIAVVAIAGMYALNRYKAFLAVQFTGAALCVPLAVVFVQFFGLEGAGLAMVVLAAITTTSLIWLLARGVGSWPQSMARTE